LKIPQTLEYGDVLIKQQWLLSQNSNIEIAQMYENFLELEKIMPSNALVKYNLRLIELKFFSEDEIEINRFQLHDNLTNLSKYKQLDARLVKRLFINYHLLLGEYYTNERDYANKNKSVNYIFSNYKGLKMSDLDRLNMANYFIEYSNSQLAIDILQPRVNASDVNEDLLFQYINLTILKAKYNSKSTYVKVLQNAEKVNHQRFCNLFESVNKGGISFQLLADPVNKKLYCEKCSQ
jgi:hypothetical protein